MALPYNHVVMSNGTEYRVLIDYNELIQKVDAALKEGGLMTVPMGMEKPGELQVINPAHIITIDNMQVDIDDDDDDLY